MQGPGHPATPAPPTYGAADLAVWRCLSTEKSPEVPSSSGGMYCTGQERVVGREEFSAVRLGW